MPKTVLLADDSVTIQKVVGISFANEDVVLQTVDNGDDAVTRAREVRPDIVLADVVMPGMNGYEVCEALKGDSELRGTPVLLLTGTFEAFDEERASRAGADGHITKPFEAQALVDQVNALLAARASAPAPREAEAPAAAAEPQAEASGASSFIEDEATAPEPRGAPAAAGGAGAGEPALDLGGRGALGDEAPLEGEAELDAGASLGEDELGGDGTVALDFGGEELDGGEAFSAAAEEAEAPSPPAREAPERAPGLGEADLTQADASAPVPGAGGGETRILSELDTDPLFGDAPSGSEAEALEFDTDEGGGATAPGASAGSDPLAEPGAAAFGGEALADPDRGRDYDVSASDLGDPLAGPTAAAASAAEPAAGPAPPPAAEPASAEPAAAGAGGPAPEATPGPAPAAEGSGRSAAGAPDLSPAARQRLHDTLEHVAWEAFGDVSERIVNEALERIEKVAWEVIPQMAEALIEEEIRRLKEES